MLLISPVQQSDSIIHIYAFFFIFFNCGFIELVHINSDILISLNFIFIFYRGTEKNTKDKIDRLVEIVKEAAGE